MPLIHSLKFNHSLKEIRILTAIISALFSIIAFSVDDLINSDGVLYMNMVRAFLDGGLTETAQLFNWPFFSILVSGIHLITGLPLETCGEILNTLMFVLFTDAVLLICSKILPNNRQIFIAALFILGFTLFNDYRAYLFRDLGYWAFMAYGIYHFINFLETPKWLYAILWQLAMLAAFLFRIEAIVLMLLLPFFLLSQSRELKTSFKQIGMVFSLLAGLGILAIAISLGIQGFATAFGKVSEIFIYLDIPTLMQNFQDKSEIINREVLSKFDKGSGGLILSSGLVIMMIKDLILSLSGVYIFFYAYAYLSRTGTENVLNPYRAFLIYFVTIYFIILLALVFTHYFLSTRYGIMLITGLFLLMLPRMCQFVENAWLQRRKGILFFTFLILVAGPVDTFTVSVSKGYIKDAAIWAAENLPENSKTLTSDVIIDYYMRENNSKTRVNLDIQNRPLNISSYDYVIVTIKTNRDGVEKYLDRPLSEFEIVHSNANRRGDKVLVLEISE